MKTIQIVLMVGTAAAAVIMDVKTGRIPNLLIIIGLAVGGVFRLSQEGILGLLLFAGGTGVPILVFGLLYYFRMIGAGDIKLLCVLGGYSGPVGSLTCIFWSILWGGLISLGIMIARRNLVQRMEVFFRYMIQYGSGSREPYMGYVQDDGKFCFSIPVLLGVLCYSGGIL